MANGTNPGTCAFCGGEHPKAAMTRHVSSCARRGRGTEERWPIVVEGRWAPAYWLHLEVKPDVTLRALDAFLRQTWLECCGHLSSFEVADRRFDSDPDDFDPDGSDTMDVAVREALRPGATARYEYDFGSTTELKLRVLAPRTGPPGKDPVRLVARNTPPSIPCRKSQGEAAHVCASCGQPVCQACAAGHRCGTEMLLPVVNSPRVGTCAYGT